MHNLGGCLNVPWASYSKCEEPREFSSWVKKMTTLVDKLAKLETAASKAREHQPQLESQVKALRIALKGQEDRCIAFLELTEKYSERFLADVEEDIKQHDKQVNFLSSLNGLLAEANNLHKWVHELQKSYEDGIGCITVKNIPNAAKKDVKSLRDILEEIQPPHEEMDKFWAAEENRLTHLIHAPKDRRLNPKDIDHWGGYQENWEKVKTKDEKTVDLVARRGLGSDAVSIVNNMRHSSQSGFANATSLVEAVGKFTKNNESREKFFKECDTYWEYRENEIKKMLDTSYSPFSRSRASQDLVDRATKLSNEGKDVARYEGIKDVECLSLLKKMDGKLEVLLAHFPAPAWATQMGSHSPFPLFNIEELKALSRGRKDSKDRLAAMWTRVDPAKFPPSGGTGQ